MRSKLDDRSDLHFEPGLFAHLASDPGFERLPQFQGAARKAPLPGQRFELALNQDDVALVDDHGANADDGALGIPARRQLRHRRRQAGLHLYRKLVRELALRMDVAAPPSITKSL